MGLVLGAALSLLDERVERAAMTGCTIFATMYQFVLSTRGCCT